VSGALPTRQEIVVLWEHTISTASYGEAETFADALVARLRPAWAMLEDRERILSEQCAHLDVARQHAEDQTTDLRADLRACAEALRAIYDFEKDVPKSVRNAGLLETAYAALARPGVQKALTP